MEPASGAKALVDRAVSSPGEALPDALRETSESSLGHDFSTVRIHRDGSAASAARAVDAHAFTSGSDIVFDRDEYAPATEAGKRLITHELTHVVQQGAAAPLGGPTSEASSPSRRAGTVQRSPRGGDEATSDDTSLESQVKRNHGGLEVKLPLNSAVLGWVEAARAGEVPENPGSQSKPLAKNDPSKYKKKLFYGPAFVWDEKDNQPVDVTDVSQGYLGDCYFMALLAAIAQTNPEFIERMIQPRADGTFKVTFFGPGGERVEEIVEPRFPAIGQDPVYGEFGDVSAAHGRELWPMLIEKAYAQHLGGWLQTEGSKTKPGEYAKTVTGQAAEFFKLPADLSNAELLQKLIEHFVTANRPATFYSHKSKDYPEKKEEKSGVIANHTYALRGVDRDTKTADLYNPHAKKHLEDKGMGFLRTHFRTLALFRLGSWGTSREKTASPPTAEEALAEKDIPQQMLADSGFGAMVAAFKRELEATDSNELDATKSLLAVRATVERHAEQLWEQATLRAQGKGTDTDDRPLYWARLEMAAALRQFSPSAWRMTPVEKRLLIEIFEAASRGRTDISFDTVAIGDRRVLVAGFDPFGFQYGGSLRKANPSGAAALALDGTPISSGEVTGRVESVVFPVRFDDFDRNVVENTFRPFLAKKDRVDMIMTISQGGGDLEKDKAEAFELEQYAGRRRSSEWYPDNVNRRAGSPSKPVEGRRMVEGPEFLESSLPWKDIHAGVGRGQTTEESELKYLPEGATSPVHSTKGGVPKTHAEGAKAVEGSGGGYLSNEVFYRTALVRSTQGSKVPVGHLHVPYLGAPKGNTKSEKKHAALRDKIVGWVKKIIQLALPKLSGRKKQKKKEKKSSESSSFEIAP
jgi:pyrrolidone-carboxylate peptidase